MTSQSLALTHPPPPPPGEAQSLQALGPSTAPFTPCRAPGTGHGAELPPPRDGPTMVSGWEGLVRTMGARFVSFLVVPRTGPGPSRPDAKCAAAQGTRRLGAPHYLVPYTAVCCSSPCSGPALPLPTPTPHFIPSPKLLPLLWPSPTLPPTPSLPQSPCSALVEQPSPNPLHSTGLCWGVVSPLPPKPAPAPLWRPVAPHSSPTGAGGCGGHRNG